MNHTGSAFDQVLYRIGVDGGGTSTRARLTRANGEVLGESRAGPSGLMQGTAQAWRHIEQAIAQAVQASGLSPEDCPRPDTLALGIGLAGANNARWRNDFLAANPGYLHLAVDTDAFVALLGAHGGRAGALVIVGTGSIALAWLPDGTRRNSGGWGFPSGDEGSGSHLGLQAATLTQHAVDGRHAHSALTQAVLAATGGSAAALLDWCGQAAQHEFATLAPLVFESELNDPLAAHLLQQSVDAIEALVLALDPAGALPLAIGGSVGQRLSPRLSASTRARLVASQGDAMDGALSLCSPIKETS